MKYTEKVNSLCAHSSPSKSLASHIVKQKHRLKQIKNGKEKNKAKINKWISEHSLIGWLIPRNINSFVLLTTTICRFKSYKRKQTYYGWQK